MYSTVTTSASGVAKCQKFRDTGLQLLCLALFSDAEMLFAIVIALGSRAVFPNVYAGFSHFFSIFIICRA